MRIIEHLIIRAQCAEPAVIQTAAAIITSVLHIVREAQSLEYISQQDSRYLKRRKKKEAKLIKLRVDWERGVSCNLVICCEFMIIFVFSREPVLKC